MLGDSDCRCWIEGLAASQPNLFTESPKWSRHPFFRSYGARLPSSLTRFHSRALAQLCPPTCVGFRYGQPWEHPEVFLGSCFNGSASAEASTSLPLQKQFALTMQVNERMSQLHQAVNEIRDLRSQIQNLHKRFGDDQRLKAALVAADDLDHKMSEVEKKLIQVNMKGSEANLAFPNMLNERFDTFSHLIEGGDSEPTKSQLDVFQTLSSQLQEQLKKWAQLKNEDLPKVSELIKQANLPALIVTQPKKSE